MGYLDGILYPACKNLFKANSKEARAKKIRHDLLGQKYVGLNFRRPKKVFCPTFPGDFCHFGQMNNLWQLKFWPFSEFSLRVVILSVIHLRLKCS